MTGWTIREVLEATAGHGTSFLSEGEHKFASVCTDTRKLASGSLFVPLVGASHDGHDHVAAALQAGAGAALWARPGELPPELAAAPLVRCSDTLQALQDLGRYHLRRRVGCKVVAVTGSTGKTTTKDLIAAVLSARFKVSKTQGNYNNDIGVPLTLLDLPLDTDVAVIELGMRGLEQIRRLALLIEPDIGVITNIGVSHIELLGDRQGIARAKGELFESMGPDRVAIVPRDSDFYDYLRGLTRGPVVSFSGLPDSPADVRPLELESLGLDGWRVQFEAGCSWEFPLPGEHHVEDLAAAWAVARQLGVDAASASTVVREVQVSNLRMERRNLDNGLVVLNDAYNAAPDSMRSSLQVLSYAAGRKVAVLGDMLELGSFEEQAHHQLGELVGSFQIPLLVAVGPRSRTTVSAAEAAGVNACWAADVAEAAKILNDQVQTGDTLLLKASRGVGLDRLVPELEKWHRES